MRVGLFDSGVGGLTVLKQLKKKYPHNDYVYYGDTANIPYGNKSIEELCLLAKKNVEFLISKKVDMIIIACGTVSSNCLEYLKNSFNIPIVSILPPVIDFINNSKYRKVLVMATDKTIAAHYFKNNILNREVIELACPLLASLIEQDNKYEIDMAVHSYLDKYNSKVDLLVLACTHYPLVIDNIKEAIGEKTKILDMASLLKIDDSGSGTISIYFSQINDIVIKNVKKVIGYNINNIDIA